MSELKTKFYILKKPMALHYRCDECGAFHEDNYDTNVVFDVDTTSLIDSDIIDIWPVGKTQDGQIVRVSSKKSYTWDNDEKDFEDHFKRCELPVRHATIQMSSWWNDWQWRKLRVYEQAIRAYETELIRLRNELDSE